MPIFQSKKIKIVQRSMEFLSIPTIFIRYLVEGGARLIASFLQEKLADKLYLFLAPSKY